MTYDRHPIPFAEINAVALGCMATLVRRWFPNGRLEGHDWVVGNLKGEHGRSLHIVVSDHHPRHGIWKDFSTGEGGGDPISLIAAMEGISQTEAARRLGVMLGVIDDHEQRIPDDRFRPLAVEEITAPTTAEPGVKPPDSEAARLSKARGLASECVPIAGTPAAAYLTGRFINPDEVPAEEVGWHQPSTSILYVARDAAGDVTAIQRVFLNPDGTAELDTNGKKIKRTNGMLKGSAFTLPGDGTEILVCDGPEDALSLRQATRLSVRCAFGMSWGETPLPEGVSVVLVADNDSPDGAASKAVMRAASRLAERGYRVKLTHPPAGVKDANDLLREQGAEAVRAMVAAAVPLSDATAEPGDDFVPFDHKAEIGRLAKLRSSEYKRERSAAAKSLGIRPAALDEIVKSIRSRRSATDADDLFPDVKPWPSPVDAAELFDDIRHTVRRFVALSPEASAATALWSPFTWLIDKVKVAPILVITAPEKRCGKSELLKLVGRLSYRSLPCSNISSAAIYRVIEAWEPTLLIDEANTFLKQQSEFESIINSGHTRELAYVIRVVGDDYEPILLKTWGAKVTAGIGPYLPETTVDRAIVLELRRKLPHEKVERLRHAEPEVFDELRRKLARFAEDAGDIIMGMRPALPAELNDRAQDNWEPLLAIADYAGGHWPETARATALQLSGVSGEALSLSGELLADIRDILEQRKVDQIPTADLLADLVADEERPWATYSRGRSLTPRNLAKLLHQYGIASKNLWIGNRVVRKGFIRDEFEDAFARYLPVEPPESAAVPPGADKNQESLQVPGLVGRILLPPLPPPPPPPLPSLPLPPQPLPPPSPPPPPPQMPPTKPPTPQMPPQHLRPLADSGCPPAMAACAQPPAITKAAETQASSGIAGELGDIGDDIEL